MKPSKYQLALLAVLGGGSLLFFEFPPAGVSVTLVGNVLQVAANAAAMWYAFFVTGACYMASLMRPFGSGALAWPWYAMSAGTVVIAVSNSLYALLQLRDLYRAGSLIDLGLVYGALFVALGGWLQHWIMTHDLAAGGEIR